MKRAGLSIHYLGHHPGYIGRVARWSWDEWRQVYERRGQAFEDALKNYAERLNVDRMPLALIAFDEAGELAGVVSLKYEDLDIRPEITTWLGGLYVSPKWRGRGVATSLMNRAVDEARRLQLPSLHLWTASAEKLYDKLGWKPVERMEYHGNEIVMMEFPLNR